VKLTVGSLKKPLAASRRNKKKAGQDPPLPEDDACLTMLAGRLAMCDIGRKVAQLPNCAADTL
jgi:hypothetical protein